jgi:hypothetical protein
MEHVMRKIATLLAAAIATVTLAAGSSAVSPSSAHAAACKWGMPSHARIVQGNNHSVDLTYNRGTGAWRAKAYNRGKQTSTSTAVAFTSFTPRLVKFIITWINDTAGVYTGTIDGDGFVDGTTRDRFNPSQKTTWYMSGRARCG